jgi:hypothetical protein
VTGYRRAHAARARGRPCGDVRPCLEIHMIEEPKTKKKLDLKTLLILAAIVGGFVLLVAFNMK